MYSSDHPRRLRVKLLERSRVLRVSLGSLGLGEDGDEDLSTGEVHGERLLVGFVLGDVGAEGRSVPGGCTAQEKGGT